MAKKANKKLNIFEIILIVFFLIQPFLDVIATTSLSFINIGIRGLFFVFAIGYLIYKKFNFKIMSFILASLFLTVGYQLLTNEEFINVISSTMKLMYLPLIFCFFYAVKNEINEKYYIIVLSIYIFLYLIAYLFNFGNSIYLVEEGKTGFKGLFNSINELGTILTILLPISLDYLKKKKNIILSILLIIGYMGVILLSGTKVLMIGFLIIIVFVYYKDIIKMYNKFSITKKIILVAILVISLILGIYLLQFTRFYQNMVVQNDFFKVNNIFSLDFVNKVLFNNRFEFLNMNLKFLGEQKIIKYIFGIGYFNELKFVEIDMFDLFFRYGIVGIIIFITPIISVFKKIDLGRITLFTFVLVVLISFTSGHVLLNPNVIIIAGYLLLLKENEKEELDDFD